MEEAHTDIWTDPHTYTEVKLYMSRSSYDGSKQEGHDGPVSLHWLIPGNLFKTYDPEEGLKLVAMSSNKKILKYFTK